MSQCAVEVKNDQQVNAICSDEPGFSLKGCEEFGSVSRGKKLDGMRLEGDGGSFGPQGAGNFHDPLKQFLVGQVDSIKVTDGDYARGRRWP